MRLLLALLVLVSLYYYFKLPSPGARKRSGDLSHPDDGTSEESGEGGDANRPG